VLAQGYGLRQALAIEHAVEMSLEAALAIPFGLAVAYGEDVRVHWFHLA
jgi:hypothetical protein